MSRPRIRSLKPDIWQDEKLGRCSIGARLLFVGLISQADDEGRFRAAPALMRASIFPHDDPLAGMDGQLPGIGASGLDVDGWLVELSDAQLIRLYEIRGERYGDLPGWAKHQRVDHPRPSELPSCKKPRRPKRPISPKHAGLSQKPRDDSRILPPDRDRDRDKDKSVVDPAAPDRPRSDVDRVWGNYQHRHPTARLTTARRELIKRRLRDYDVDTLKAAIEGNHLDPFCNGENDRGQTYHGLELILRDAEHVERYAAIAHQSRNGHGPTGESRLDRAHRIAVEKGFA